MSKILSEVIKIIYGPYAAYSKVMILFGIPIAAAAFMRPPSSNYFDPLILLIIPAWSLYIFVNIFTILRKPRASNLAYILGIDYHCRITAAGQYIKRKLTESFFSLLPSVIVFLPIRLLTASLEANNDTFFICLCVCIEYCCMVILFKSIIRYSLIKPEKHDTDSKRNVVEDKPLNIRINIRRYSLLQKISSIGTWGFNRKCKALIRRQWMYLFSYEWLSFSSIFTICLLSGTYLSFVIPSENNTLSILMTFFFPMIVFVFTIRTFSESALMIRCCPYYNVTRRDLFTANMVISSLLLLPYIVLIFIRIWIFQYPLVNVFPVAFSFSALVYLHAYRSMYPGLNILGIFQIGVLGICVFISVSLAVSTFLYSLCFACIPLVFIFASNRLFSNSL